MRERNKESEGERIECKEEIEEGGVFYTLRERETDADDNKCA